MVFVVSWSSYERQIIVSISVVNYFCLHLSLCRIQQVPMSLSSLKLNITFKTFYQLTSWFFRDLNVCNHCLNFENMESFNLKHFKKLVSPFQLSRYINRELWVKLLVNQNFYQTCMLFFISFFPTIFSC